MIIERCHLSERRACWLVGLSRSAFRNPPMETEENGQLAPAEFAARFRDVSKEELHLATEDFAN